MFVKECKKVLFSLTFLIFVGVMLVDFCTQYGNALTQMAAPPQPGYEEYLGYGHAEETDKSVVMQKALPGLIEGYQNNQYVTYPLGFYKNVRLNQEKHQKMGEILEELTGYEAESLANTAFEIPSEVYDEASGGLVEVVPEGAALPMVSDHVTYDRFVVLMETADDLLGGGSSYGSEFLGRLGWRGKTYEEALDTYEQLKAGGFSRGYAQLLCDYLCLFATLFGAFIAVAEWMRDKQARARNVIYTRRVSSLQLTLTRYGAVIGLCMAVVWLLAAVAMVALKLQAGSAAGNLHVFFGYTTIWVMPSVMVSAAIGAFFTELTDTPIGLLVMGGYWFAELNGSNGLLISGLRPWDLMPRNNSMYETAAFAAQWDVFLQNRLGFVLVSLLLVALSAGILACKRKGEWLSVGKIAMLIKSKSAV